jgi:ATP-binding cassette subfamily A (ABC1) protein 3
MFVVLISVASTAVIQGQAPFWALGHLFFVILLHGIAATLLAYLISMFSRSQPAALGFSILIMGIEYVVSFIVMVVS